jgi:hypothetical protein
VDELTNLTERSGWRTALLAFAAGYHNKLLKDYQRFLKGFRKGAYKA